MSPQSDSPSCHKVSDCVARLPGSADPKSVRAAFRTELIWAKLEAQKIYSDAKVAWALVSNHGGSFSMPTWHRCLRWKCPSRAFFVKLSTWLNGRVRATTEVLKPQREIIKVVMIIMTSDIELLSRKKSSLVSPSTRPGTIGDKINAAVVKKRALE